METRDNLLQSRRANLKSFSKEGEKHGEVDRAWCLAHHCIQVFVCWVLKQLDRWLSVLLKNFHASMFDTLPRDASMSWRSSLSMNPSLCKRKVTFGGRFPKKSAADILIKPVVINHVECLFELLYFICYLGTPSRTKLSVFFNIVQTAFAPPPLVFEHSCCGLYCGL